MTKYYKLLKDTPTEKAGTVYRDKDIYLSNLVSGVDTFYIPDIRDEDFDEWFEEVADPNEPEHSLGWEPKYNKKYYFDGGFDVPSRGVNDNTSADKSIIPRGGAKQAYNEVVQERKIAEAKHKIWKYMREHDMFFDVDWRAADQDKHVISGWDYIASAPDIENTRFIDTSQHSLVFASREHRQEILDKFPDELKLILKRW